MRWIRTGTCPVVIVPLVLLFWAVTACSSIGPATVTRDRFDYVSAISDSWKQQLLLNIIKIRYADNPVFMDVGQVISGYELEGTLSAGGTLGDKSWRNAGGAVGTFVDVGASGRFMDRPTITYSPLTGADFMKTMLTPFPPGSIMFLAEAGWPVDFLLQTGTQAINGIRNRKPGIGARPADPEFVQVVKLLRRIQDEEGIGFRVYREKDGQEATMMLIQARHLTPDSLKDMAEVKRMLRLNPEATEIRITYGSDAQHDDEIALHTRSAYQVLIALAALVSVPPEHIAEQRTIVGTAPEAEPGLPPIAKIHSGTERPTDAFVLAKYRDHWYWVDDRDFRSKRTFTFLTVLFTLSETGQKIQQPILTIRAN